MSDLCCFPQEPNAFSHPCTAGTRLFLGSSSTAATESAPGRWLLAHGLGKILWDICTTLRILKQKLSEVN